MWCSMQAHVFIGATCLILLQLKGKSVPHRSILLIDHSCWKVTYEVQAASTCSSGLQCMYHWWSCKMLQASQKSSSCKSNSAFAVLSASVHLQMELESFILELLFITYLLYEPCELMMSIIQLHPSCEISDGLTSSWWGAFMWLWLLSAAATDDWERHWIIALGGNNAQCSCELENCRCPLPVSNKVMR